LSLPWLVGAIVTCVASGCTPWNILSEPWGILCLPEADFTESAALNFLLKH